MNSTIEQQTTLSIFDTPDQAEARVLAHRLDPDTSHEAAAKLTNTEAVKLAILELLAESSGGLTAFQAQVRYFDQRDRRGWPAVQEYSINRRMSDLHREGRVEDTGRRRQTPSGSTAVVWAVAG